MMGCPITQLLSALAKAQEAFGQDKPPGFRYANIADYVLQNSKCSRGRVLTPDEQQYVDSIRARTEETWGPAQPKECYANAQKLVLEDRDLKLVYAEGYACHTGGIIPVMHGWAELDGAIIDPTPVWEDMGIGLRPDGYCYHGAFLANRDTVRARMIERGELASFIDDWREGFPLLREQ